MLQKNKLKVLGCVSPYPTLIDNCPGYLIEVDKIKILLDCGSGTCKKLNIPKDFENLYIVISHFHKDHYSDIYAIAYASQVYAKMGLLKEKIKVFIPKAKKDSYEYNDYHLFKMLKEHYFEIIEYNEEFNYVIESIKMSFMKNYHSIDTYSTKLEFNSKMIVYTADTGNKNKHEIIEFCKDADFLIIESTYLESDFNKSEFHLSALQAASIAKEANVKKMILTHFWPKYDKKKYLKEAQKEFKESYIACNEFKI